MSELRSPSWEEVNSPLFNAIWSVIKHWDISRTANGRYAGASGTDVCMILDAIKSVEPVPVQPAAPKRGDPTVGRTLDEEHRPLVCFVCGKQQGIAFNFCQDHKDEYEALKRASIASVPATPQESAADAQLSTWSRFSYEEQLKRIREVEDWESSIPFWAGQPRDLCGPRAFAAAYAAHVTATGEHAGKAEKSTTMKPEIILSFIAKNGKTCSLKPETITSFITKNGETCSFESALNYLQEQGVDESSARSWLWGLLALDHIRFTLNRNLTLPNSM